LSAGLKRYYFALDVHRGDASVSLLHAEELWQARAACRGPHTSLFFPPSHFERKEDKERRESQAKAICATCPVRKPCLEYALRIREPHGIWGGLNEIERRALSPH
jgi:WhiB family redox-sensing transcriptional regulator